MAANHTNPSAPSPAAPPAADGLIRDPKQIRSLVSPARQEIVDAIHATGPLTIAQIAAVMGRPADSLYFHVRTLERVGLLLKVGEAPTGRRAGGIYDVCARPLRIQYDTSRPAVAKAIIAVSGSMVRLAHRDFSRAFRHKLVKPEGEHRNTWSGRAKGWLTADEVAEINQNWRRIIGILQDARPRPGATLHAATFLMTPVLENKRAKAAKAAGRRKESK